MLTLPIKKKWFDMILSGKKKEEYREIKQYYTSRFQNLYDDARTAYPKDVEICFRNGYSSNSPSFIAVCDIKRGIGNPKWGATPNTEYYILEIHTIKK